VALTKVRGAGAEGLTLSSTDVTVASGDLLFGTSAKGVVLGATSNTSSNTLDDYEEGTWTPTYQSGQGIGGLTLTRNLARYIKVGKQVSIMGWIQADASYTVNGHTYITNAPFDPNCTTSGLLRQTLGVWGADDPASAAGQSSGFGTLGMIRAGYAANTITLYHVTGTVSDTEFIFGCTYFID